MPLALTEIESLVFSGIILRMDFVNRVLWTTSYRVTLLFSTLFFSSLATLSGIVFFPIKDKAVDTVVKMWAVVNLKAANVTVTTVGVEHVPEGPPYIISFNHISDFDIYAMMVGLPTMYRAIMKKEIIYYPILGQLLPFLGFVPIDRGNVKKAVKSLQKAAKYFHRYPFIMALTGTRIYNKDYFKKKMKKGPVMTAMQHSVPILPVTIIGADDVHRKGIGLINPGRNIELIVHPVMEVSGCLEEERNELTEQLKMIIGTPLIERGIASPEETTHQNSATA